MQSNKCINSISYGKYGTTARFQIDIYLMLILYSMNFIYLLIWGEINKCIKMLLFSV